MDKWWINEVKQRVWILNKIDQSIITGRKIKLRSRNRDLLYVKKKRKNKEITNNQTSDLLFGADGLPLGEIGDVLRKDSNGSRVSLCGVFP